MIRKELVKFALTVARMSFVSGLGVRHAACDPRCPRCNDFTPADVDEATEAYLEKLRPMTLEDLTPEQAADLVRDIARFSTGEPSATSAVDRKGGQAEPSESDSEGVSREPT